MTTIVHISNITFVSDCRKLVNKHQVETLQDQAQLALAHYVSQSHPHNPARFGKMLLTLPNLKTIEPAIIEQTFFKHTIGATNINHILKAIQ